MSKVEIILLNWFWYSFFFQIDFSYKQLTLKFWYNFGIVFQSVLETIIEYLCNNCPFHWIGKRRLTTDLLLKCLFWKNKLQFFSIWFWKCSTEKNYTLNTNFFYRCFLNAAILVNTWFFWKIFLFESPGIWKNNNNKESKYLVISILSFANPMKRTTTYLL